MKIYDDLKTLNFKNATACALGNFDGVHIGHQKLIRQMLEVSTSSGLEPTIVTFEPHPSTVLVGADPQPLITTPEKKQAVMETYKVEKYLRIPFDHKFAMMQYRDFIHDILIDKCKAKAIVAGVDYRFGYRGEGNLINMREICKKEGIKVLVVDPLYHQGHMVSSTLIRRLIKAGDVKKASAFLGRPYSITGTVVKGDAIGRKLGFPTANLEFSTDIVLPPKGVYAVIAQHNCKHHQGIANIGTKPTFNGKEIKLETHLFNFDDEIYGDEIEVFFFDSLRGEIKFKSPIDLVRQVNKDFVIAKKVLSRL